MSQNETHVLPLKIYLLIFAVLLVMTGVTVQVAYVDLGFMNTVVALGIACFKASLVVLYFMHLRYSSSLPKLFWVAGLLWLAMLITFAMSDYLTRQWIEQPQGWARNRGISIEQVAKQ
ncbi:MAG: cytochrome C oxidase subunit IV family protein [Acidobacteria bacterium]|nr:cytochrome C oxidase subunit IV family protein [Acidobacteriota bacterium]